MRTTRQAVFVVCAGSASLSVALSACLDVGSRSPSTTSRGAHTSAETSLRRFRRYRRRALTVIAALLVWYGLANVVSPVGNRLWGAVMLSIGLAELLVLRFER